MSLIAGNVQETFLKGNAAYLAGNIDDAIKFYKSMEPKGPAVWYNLGNCYYGNGDYPQAIVYWSRAQKDAPWRDNTMLESYIVQAYDQLGIAHDVSLMTSMHILIKRVSALFSMFVLQILFLCCFVLLFYLLRCKRYYIVTVLSSLVIIIGVLCIVKYREQKYPYGIVTKSSISVYAGPGQDYARLTEARMLDRVRVYESRDGWLKVKINQFGYGWIQFADLAML